MRRWWPFTRGSRNGADPLACIELVELVTAYLEDTLSDADRARFDDHIGACPHCRTYLEQMRDTIRLTGRLTAESLSVEMRGELLTAFSDWKAAR